MTVSTPMVGRHLVSFRLADLPETIRQRGKDVALRRALRAGDSPFDRFAIGMAADVPSDTVYWVSRAAWDRVMRRRR